MKRYLPKRIVIEAIPYSHDLDVSAFKGVRHCLGTHGHIQTINGEVEILTGDYICKDSNGYFYPCSKKVFEEKYEEVV